MKENKRKYAQIHNLSKKNTISNHQKKKKNPKPKS